MGTVIGTDAAAMFPVESGGPDQYGGVSIPAYLKWHMSSDVVAMGSSDGSEGSTLETDDATEDSGLECCTPYWYWNDVRTTFAGDPRYPFFGRDASNTTHAVAQSLADVEAVNAAGERTWARATYHMYLKQDGLFSYSPGWVTGSGAVWSGHGVHESTKAGQSASITATGNEFAVVMDKGSNRGTADVYMDGTRFASVNLGGSVSVNRVVVAEKYKVTAGQHTIKVVSTSGRVDLDSLIVS